MNVPRSIATVRPVPGAVSTSIVPMPALKIVTSVLSGSSGVPIITWMAPPPTRLAEGHAEGPSSCSAWSEAVQAGSA